MLGTGHYPASVTLLLDLYAFPQEHRRCGELNADVAEVIADRWRVWMTCTCGAAIRRLVDDE